MMDLEIVRLRGDHDRSQFQCGNVVLDNWLRQNAGQFDRRDLAKVYVATRPKEQRILGYYSLSSHSLARNALQEAEARRLPNVDIPVFLIGKLAVDQSVQGQGLEGMLLVDALQRVVRIADEVGIRAVEVDAIDDAAVSFYRKHGFSELLDDPRHLIVAIQQLRKLSAQT